MPLTCGSSTTADLLSEVNKNTNSRDFLALKIFQSPTEGGLTEIQTRTIDAGEVYEVRKTSDNSLTTIYSDAEGTAEIAQDSVSNVSDSNGAVTFYIGDGDYYINVSSVVSYFSVSKPQTTAEKTWYVDASAAGYQDGSITRPFKEVQQAWDAIPAVVRHQQTIILSDGTYSTSSIPSSEQLRPSVLWGKGKITTFRSSLSNDVITAPILIKGSSRNAASVTLQTSSDLPYGVYINKGNIGLQNLTIASGDTVSQSLLVAHRTDTYIQVENVVIEGGLHAGTTGVVAESNGQVELSNNCVVKRCGINVRTLTDGDNIIVSGNSRVEDAVNRNVLVAKGNIKFQLTVSGADYTMISGATNPVFVGSGGTFEMRGLDAGAKAVCTDSIDGIAADIELVLARIEDVVNLKNGSRITYNTSESTRNVFLRASNIYLTNANITVTDTYPVVLSNGSEIYKEGSNTLTGSGGKRETRNIPELQFTSDGASVSLIGGVTSYSLSGSGSNRAGCTLDISALPLGDAIHFEGNTWGVEIVDSANVDVNGSLLVGNAVGYYSGFSALIDDEGMMRVTGVGILRS